MSQFLNRTWLHKILDKFMPDNCRKKLEKAFVANSAACSDLMCILNEHEDRVIAALKEDRRPQRRLL